MKYPATLTQEEQAAIEADLSARRVVLTQAFISAREWERQSKQWEAVVREQREELLTLAHAAHMPADYPHGLPTWINMVLYAAYIGLDIGPHNQAWAERMEARWIAADGALREACAEKAHYMEQIEKLTQALDEQARQIDLFRATLNDLIACAGEDTPADVVAKCRAALGRVV